MEAEAETEATLTSNESLQTDMPMTMAASVVLDHLPRDAHDALSKAGMLEQEKSKPPHLPFLSPKFPNNLHHLQLFNYPESKKNYLTSSLQ